MIHAHVERDEWDEQNVAVLVSIVHEAGNPYLDWFFGGPVRAQQALERWVRRPSSQYALGRVRGIFERGVLVGAYIALSGAELTLCRKADAVAALRDAHGESRDSLAQRHAERRGLFHPVDADEFYLGSMGVSASRRAEGFGRRLLDAYLAEGEAAGYSRFRLDVAAGNAPARRLYESRGFRVIDEQTTAGGQLSYCSLVLGDSRP